MNSYNVQKDKLVSNIEAVKGLAQGRIVYGVVKGNGYGIGLTMLARTLKENGINHFAVSDIRDAVQLRLSGMTDEEILILGSFSSEPEAEAITAADAVATVGSLEAAAALAAAARQYGKTVKAHIKLDTGMGRFGFNKDELDKIISVYTDYPEIEAAGIYTHFYDAFSKKSHAKTQLSELLSVAEKLRQAEIQPGCVHAANSPFLVSGDLGDTDAVRIGSAFLGRVQGAGKAGLQPVGYAKSAVAEIRTLKKGHTVGYAGEFVTKRETRIAVIPFGYYDGLGHAVIQDTPGFKSRLRYLYNAIKLMPKGKQTYVKIGDKRAAVIGHIGMVGVVADITGIECSAGDSVRIELSPLMANPLLTRIYE